jgi:pyruvate dehydrogenase E2 component (dihydrolipoamide acetyltransferase)
VGDVIAIVGKQGEDISGIVAGLGPGSSADHAQTPTAAHPAQAMAPVSAPAAVSARSPAPRAAASSGRIKSSPLARKVAAQKGVDLRSLLGSGPEGRIVLRDITELPGSGAPGQQASLPALVQPGAGDVVVPISRMRKIIARRLSESMYSAPHYYLTVAAGMDGLLAARTKMNAGREKKLSVNAFLMSITGRTLARHPQVNTTWNGDTFIRHATADIGLAVALPEGLITPVVRDCGRKGIIAIDAELADLVERARAGRLAPEEYAGAGFTISNLGMSGIDEFTAIINPPGSAILAVGAVRKEVVVAENDAMVVRQRMRMTLSCDHRVIDGAVGAAFLRELADMLESPLLALA